MNVRTALSADIVAADLWIVRIAQFPTHDLGKTSSLIRCNPRVPGTDLTVEPDDFLIERGVRELVYTYDISDDWRHIVTLETVGPGETDCKYPRFVDGERRCPLEDVGGLRGFEMFLDAMAYPTHDQYDYLHDWYGGPTTPTTSMNASHAAPPANPPIRKAAPNSKAAYRARLPSKSLSVLQ